MKELRLTISIYFSLSLLILGSALYFLTATNFGLCASLNLINNLGIAKIDYSEIQGDLIHGVKIRNLAYQNKNYQLKFKNLAAKLSFTQIFDRNLLGFENLNIDELKISIPQKTLSDKQKHFAKKSSFPPFSIQHIGIKELTVFYQNKTLQAADIQADLNYNHKLSWNFSGQVLNFTRTANSDALQTSFKLSSAGKIIDHQLSYTIQFADIHGKLNASEFSGQAIFSGTGQSLKIEQLDLKSKDEKIKLIGLNNNQIQFKLVRGNKSNKINQIVSGQVKIPLNFKQFQVTGDLELTNYEDINYYGVNFTKAALNFKADSSQIKYSGKLYLQNDQLAITGNTDLHSPVLQTILNLQGNNLLILNNQRAKVYASSELTIDANKEKTMISGTIKIDKADFNFEKYKSAITQSSDVIIISDPKFKPNNSKLHYKIAANIDLVLAENKIYGKAFNGEAYINGHLNIAYQLGATPRANGELVLTGGKYKLFGKMLPITTGKINFSDSPLNDPSLNISMQRTIFSQNTTVSNDHANNPLSYHPVTANYVTAGLHIDGTLKYPKISLFSNPSMSQNEILAYLIIGVPLGKSGNPLGELLAQSIGQLANIFGNSDLSSFQRLQKSLHLDEINIENMSLYDQDKKENITQPTIIIGKKFYDKFYLRYGFGLLSSLSVFQMRYNINKNLALQGEMYDSRNNGADLVYSLEK